MGQPEGLTQRGIHGEKDDEETTVTNTVLRAGSLALPARTANLSLRAKALLGRTTFLVGLLVLWEVLARAGVIDESFASKPTSLVLAAGSLVRDAEVRGALSETLTSVAASFVIGTALGVLVGVTLGLQRLLRDAYLPIVMILLGTPKSVFLPVIVLFFGLGQATAIVFGSLLAFVHVTVNAVAGVDLVENKHLEVARAYRASSWRRFRHVVLPAASPGLFTGLWHGLRNGFVGVVIAELFASTAGMGYLVRTYSNNLETDRALALVLVVSVVIILVGTGWNRLEAQLTRWRESEYGT